MHLRATTKPTVCWEANRTGLTWEAWIWFTEPADKLFYCLGDCGQANKLGGLSGETLKKRSQHSLQGGRTLLWLPLNVNSNIYVEEGIFFLCSGRNEKGKRSQRRRPLPLQIAAESWFEGTLDAIARDGIEYQLFPRTRQGRQLSSLARPALFS